MDLLTQGRVSRINDLAAAVLADSQRRASRVFPSGKTARLGMGAEDVKEYSVSRAIQCMLGTLRGGLEAECNRELHARNELPLAAFAIPLDVLETRTLYPNFLTATTAPHDLSFIEMLRNKSIAFRLGAQRLQDLTDTVAIPRQLTDATLAWMAPNGSVTATDSSFGQVSATPKTAVAITEVSEQLLHQSSADTIIMAGLAAVVAVGVDAAIINGTGGSQPVGILNTPGIGTVSGTSLGYAGLVGVQKTVADASAIINPQTLAYATTPAVSEQLKNRQRFASTDSPLWIGALHDGTVEGVRAVASKQMPTSTLLFGDWSTAFLCEWGPLLLSADRGGTRFNQGIVGIRARWMVDGVADLAVLVRQNHLDYLMRDGHAGESDESGIT